MSLLLHKSGFITPITDAVRVLFSTLVSGEWCLVSYAFNLGYSALPHLLNLAGKFLQIVRYLYMCQQLLSVVCPPRIHISLCKLHMARSFAWEKANRSFWAFYDIHVVLCYLNMCYKFHFVSIYLPDNGENEKIQPETFKSNSNICLVYAVSLWYDHMTGNTIIFLPC